MGLFLKVRFYFSIRTLTCTKKKIEGERKNEGVEKKLEDQYGL